MMEKVDKALANEIEQMQTQGRVKLPEHVITNYLSPKNGIGARYKVQGYEQKFIRMNSNSYLSLSNHPKLIEAADQATHQYGVGPGAVRFIDGTFHPHVALEQRIASFLEKKSARIFNSAYTSNLALALTLHNESTFWIGDELNHNSIIRSMRIANVPSSNRAIYRHNDMMSLDESLQNIPSNIKRVCVIFDGVFSMRGDYADLSDIIALVRKYQNRFEEGIITIVDDSHGIGAYGDTGRGTCEITNSEADIVVGTFGKSFGVNGGFIAGSEILCEAIRQKADTYIYTNPLSMADCVAILTAIDILDSQEGLMLLKNIKDRTLQFRKGLHQLDLESIEGIHPVVPVLVRDTHKTQHMVAHLFDLGIMSIGLTFPVVPRGAETIRMQINAGHTETDISYVLSCLEKSRNS